MTHDLLDLGISRFLGQKIAENNRKEIIARNKGEQTRPSYFVVQLRHWAKQKGFDIGKFV